MQCVILAGGMGTRISEESSIRPKPMIEIGGKPIIWHIMKIYGFHGINDFIICCGYKGYMLKEYFVNYFVHESDITVDLRDDKMTIHERRSESWKVTLVDTGETTQTGGRLKRIFPYLTGTFCMTYGDGLGSINISELVAFHKERGKRATMTAVRPPARFGALKRSGDKVVSFAEKPAVGEGFINGGFFVLEPNVVDLIDGDHTAWEGAPLENLARADQLGAYEHTGFWHPMDTLRDRTLLEELWKTRAPPWRIWAHSQSPLI